MGENSEPPIISSSPTSPFHRPSPIEPTMTPLKFPSPPFKPNQYQTRLRPRTLPNPDPRSPQTQSLPHTHHPPPLSLRNRPNARKAPKQRNRHTPCSFITTILTGNRYCGWIDGRMDCWYCSWRTCPNNRIVCWKSTSYHRGFTPLIYYVGWAISTGPESKYQSIPDLKGSSIGISRIGRFVLPLEVLYN